MRSGHRVVGTPGIDRRAEVAGEVRRWVSARPHRAIPALSALVLVLVQISYPLSAGSARDRITVAVVVLSVATALLHAATTRGPRWAVGFFVIVSGIGLSSEIVGTDTGMPFGAYAYATDRLGPALADVPLVVPLAWTGGLYPIWIVASLLAANSRTTRTVVFVLGAVGWDLFLDPQMVADGQWSWAVTDAGLPGLPEIPYTNYLGWALVAAIMALSLTVLDRALPPAHDPSVAVPVAVFGWTWLGSTLAHAVFLGLGASAAWGFAALALLGIPLLLRARTDLAEAGARLPAGAGKA
ncbi:carotenoid biosynthesis protein [Nocardia halotolerans]|uniref:Carotenoid biosynthesis protein n=1 Tax=Nocardia halotolerans TaxID=1755878 RepID=A0ABV8VFJ7_9NOCA